MEIYPPYYYENIDRRIAESRLTNKPRGSFLLRQKSGKSDTLVISLKNTTGVSHHLIQKCLQTNSFYTDEGIRKFKSVIDLCAYYKENKGFESKLLFPLYGHEYEEIENFHEYQWFHGFISKEEDSSRLTKAYRKNAGSGNDGLYLVRNKSGSSTDFVLCLVYNGEILRYIIKKIGGSYQLSKKLPNFKTLRDLLLFLKETPCSETELRCNLTTPCLKPSGLVKPSRPDKKFAKELESILEALRSKVITEDSSGSGSSEFPSRPSPFDIIRGNRDLIGDFNVQLNAEACPGYFSPYQNISKPGVSLPPDLYISQDKVEKCPEVLGRGFFGVVQPALCVINCVKVRCAVKCLSGPVIEANRKELIKEAEIMQRLDHPSIVRLLALVKHDPADKLEMVMELAHLGSLDKFIRKHNTESFSEQRCLVIMKQVCQGMAYLSDKNILHRDLAARNILLVSENFAKISDFGLSRVLAESEDYYRATSYGAWPIRWYAPETTNLFKFSSKSDVWSFGITLWEVFSYGKRPYGRMDAAQILNMIRDDQKLDCPKDCSPGIYAIMLQCWTYTTSDRPSFHEVLKLIDEYQAKKAYSLC